MSGTWILFLVLLSVTDINVRASQETETVLKIGIIIGHSIEEKPLRQAVDKLAEHYRPRFPESRIVTVWSPLNSSGSVHVTQTVCQLLNNGIQALVTVLRCRQLKSVAVMAEQLKIPHVSVSLEPCRVPDSGQFTMPFNIHNRNTHRVLSDIALFAGWQKMTLVFDKSVENRQELVLELSKNGIGSSIQSLSAMSTRHPNLAVITRSTNLTEIVSLASDLDILADDYWWVIFISDVTVSSLNDIFTPYSSSNTLLVKPKPRNIADMLVFTGIPSTQPGVPFSPVQSWLFEALLVYRIAAKNLTMSRPGMTSEQCSGTHFQSLNCSGQLMKHLRRVCDAVTDEPGCPCISTEYDLLGTETNSDTLVHVGEWTVRNKLTTRHHRLFLNKFTDFGNRAIRIGVPYYDTAPFITWIEETNSYEGLLFDIIDDLAEILKFNYSVVKPQDRVYGHRLANGSWSGMIGLVQRREVEFAAAPLTVTLERAQVVDFTTPFMGDNLGILTPRPKEVANLFQIFRPFSLGVWLSLLAFLLAALAVFVIISVKTYPFTNTRNTRPNYVQESMFSIISSCFEQGPTYHPTSVSARCFLAFWFWFSLFMINMYTADLAAVLTVSTPLDTIDTLEELVEKSDMNIILEYGSSVWALFYGEDKPLYLEVRKRVEIFDETIDTVLAGGSSFISDLSHVAYWAITHCRDVRLAEERLQSVSMAFAVPKNSIYKDAMDLSIQKMVESGIMERLIRKWWTPTGNCSGQPTETKALVLSLDRVGGTFIVYFGLCVVTGLVLTGERIFYKYLPWNTSQSPRDVERR